MFLTSAHLVLAMEYAAGGDLAHYTSVRRGLGEEEARWFFQQIMIAVDYCHRMVGWAGAAAGPGGAGRGWPGCAAPRGGAPRLAHPLRGWRPRAQPRKVLPPPQARRPGSARSWKPRMHESCCRVPPPPPGRRA